MFSRTLPIEDGSLLVMYTDGLVEKRTEDIDLGLGRMRDIFGPDSPGQSLDRLCTRLLADVFDDHQRDDIAILIARLRRTDADRHITWNLAPKLTAARRARSLIRRPLRQWGLAELIPAAELAVSELVTNAVRYAPSKIGLRLVLEGGLFCEVMDDSAALPRLRHANEDDERGRGLEVVSQISQRWGTRRAGAGKIVWCELALPSAHPAANGVRANPGTHVASVPADPERGSPTSDTPGRDTPASAGAAADSDVSSDSPSANDQASAMTGA